MGLQILEARAPQRLGETGTALRLWHGRALQRSIDHRPHRVPGPKFGFLLHITQADAFADSDFSGVRIFRTSENSQQRGFPRAVGTDEPNAISFRNGERHVLKQRVGPEGFRDAANIDQRRQGCVVSRGSLLRLTGRTIRPCRSPGGFAVAEISGSRSASPSQDGREPALSAHGSLTHRRR